MFNFCKPVSNRKRFSPHRVINDEFTFTLFENAVSIPSGDWEQVTQNKTIFLEKKYLEILEKSSHTKLNCRYVVVYCNKKPCAVIYFQVVDFRAEVFGNMLSSQVENIRSRRMNLFERYIDSNREEVLLRLFTCGNNLVSGEYGFRFSADLAKDIGHELLLNITDLVAREEKLRGTISAILLKDYYQPLTPASLFEEEKYSPFFVEPNMIIDFPAHVRSLDDYIALFNKKYRNRARSVLKSLDGVEVKDLTLDEIEQHEKRIYALYEEIFEKAKFRLMKLPVDYFSKVKKLYPETFTVKGYFAGEEMVAFASSFVTPDKCLEAHYIGFRYEINNAHDLYQNILYSMIGEGIDNQCACVNLGRTASEIKTTVGARPRELICYIKPQNTISRLIQRPFISFLQPTAWTPRNPFKETTEKSEDQPAAERDRISGR